MKYRTIVVDPPWQYRKGSSKAHGRRYAEDVYSTMTNAEIMALPIGDLAAADAHLYMWITNPRMYGERDDDSITPHDLIKAWGFNYKTCLTWLKSNFGLGSYFRGRTEHVLFAVRGDLRIEPAMRKANVFESGDDELPDGGYFSAPVTGHSAKPDVFFDLVQAASPGPYLEVFARRQRLGWDTWGNECFSAVSI